MAIKVPTPTAVVSDVSVTVAVEEPSTVPITQFTTPPPSMQLPTDAAAETSEMLVGSVMSAVTLVACEAPAFVKSNVTVAVLPSKIVGSLPFRLTRMSTVGNGVMHEAAAMSSAIWSLLH